MKSDIASFCTLMGHMHCLRGAFTKDNKLSDLKSHDWHKMLHVQLLVYFFCMHGRDERCELCNVEIFFLCSPIYITDCGERILV